jgi:2-keto-3-deoxy-L-rhamnonate aldolase RhmA
VKKAADAAFYPPKGNRGICPAVRAAHYNDKIFVDYTTWNNSEILLVPMIENPNALADLEAICAHPDVHMIVFAAGDLGFSLNEGMEMLTGPKVSAAYKQVLETAKRHNVAVIGGPILNADAEGCKKALEDGITMFSLGLDALGFRSYCQQMVNALDQGVADSRYTRPPKRDWGFKA